MKKLIQKTCIVLIFLIGLNSARSENAKWISSPYSQSLPNTWISFRKVFDIESTPEVANAKIAADSKYWLYINGQMVVFEGGLKRGPNPRDTYSDEVNIAPYLKKGKNVVAVLVWYFGKNGFSHSSSGKAGLFFDCEADNFTLKSNSSWKAEMNPAFQTCPGDVPNYRLSESNILFDARTELTNWTAVDYNDQSMSGAMEFGVEGDSPWNRLVKRPIPLWKDYGLKSYVKTEKRGDTLICDLPYDAQFTPYFKIKTKSGAKVEMKTDNFMYYTGGTLTVKAEYIAKDGVQEYESLGWMNGHKMYYIFSDGVDVEDVKYRETGYNAEKTGAFTCSDSFFNKLWEKSARTLYVTMRDTYMDCPDRERGQWTGDAVNESGEAFYALSPASSLLTQKWLHEIIGWQKQDGSLYAPVPAGNWTTELPGQVLATIGYYGLWNYYMQSGDRQTIEELYPAVKKYLSLWTLQPDGTAKVRETPWVWGDWGDNLDKPLLINGWYYLALKGMGLMAKELGLEQDVREYDSKMASLKEAFNRIFWNGTAYRSPSYKDKDDDRGQALAVVAGLADTDKYPAILKTFLKEEHASPYMEKYVFEAMMMMGKEKEALSRHKERYSEMVNDKRFTTLYEGWEMSGGTVNHAWSGGGLTILSQYVCGVSPVRPGYNVFSILPQPGSLQSAKTVVPSVKGLISSSFKSMAKSFVLEASIPSSSQAIIGVPKERVKEVKVNGKEVWKNGHFVKSKTFKSCPQYGSHIAVLVPAGQYRMEALLN